ncbi:MAG: hypothetical protein PHV07_02620 [Oscillospiraceae bacterium]|nr:hypothetical protein [Oscillospiraceae bacterium]
MSDNNRLFSRKQKLDIYSAGNIVLSAFVMGILGVAQMFWNWIVGIIIIAIGISVVFRMNLKKYTLIKNKNVVTFRRVVIIDGLFSTAAFILVWAFIFVPDPFTWEEFLNPKPGYGFPIVAYIIGGLLMIPTILTNKEIRKDM